MTADDQSRLAEAIPTRGLEQIPRMAAIASLAMLCISVSYDWSYLLALDMTFAEVSTTLQEHLRSALIWAPASVVGMMIGGMLVIASLGEDRVAKIAKGINRGLIWAVLLAGIGIGLWQRSLVLVYVAFAIAWMWGAQKALAYEPLRLAVFGPSPKFAPLFLFIVLPFLAISTGGLAYQRAHWALHHPTQRWEVIVKGAAAPEKRVVGELRRFASSAIVVGLDGRVEVLSNELIVETRLLSAARVPATPTSASSAGSSAPAPAPAASRPSL